MTQLVAATKSVLQFEGKALACPFSKLTAKELLEYILGYYESLHPSFIPIEYPAGKDEFLYIVLKEGYGLAPITSWGPAQVDVLEVAADALKATPKDQLDHDSFMEQAAWRLITRTFAEKL
ncbi:hypothetical protein [Pseudomonas chlororaphis]|uniref:hypothetical protein n=1 Tax=Pseudomonas chlororaphis TaxID=587753 RepID=UPI002407CB40|nr:hypothetical protein [Pseudomonas chlororaphis]